MKSGEVVVVVVEINEYIFRVEDKHGFQCKLECGLIIVHTNNNNNNNDNNDNNNTQTHKNKH